MDLFVYGTLRDEGLVEQLTGHHFSRLRATLRHYHRIELPNRYPWIQPAPDRSVDGVLIEGIDPSSMERIDAYECLGSLYRRIEVEVLVDGKARRCFTYVGIPEVLTNLLRS